MRGVVVGGVRGGHPKFEAVPGGVVVGGGRGGHPKFEAAPGGVEAPCGYWH